MVKQLMLIPMARQMRMVKGARGGRKEGNCQCRKVERKRERQMVKGARRGSRNVGDREMKRGEGQKEKERERVGLLRRRAEGGQGVHRQHSMMWLL